MPDQKKSPRSTMQETPDNKVEKQEHASLAQNDDPTLPADNAEESQEIDRQGDSISKEPQENDTKKSAFNTEPTQINTEQSSSVSDTIAVISGKGGSGKTIVATVIAKVLDESGISTTLIDTDIGTGGMSYYLAVNHIEGGINVGIAEMLMESDKFKSNNEKKSKNHFETIENQGLIQKIREFKHSYFVGVGDHRRLMRLKKETLFKDEIANILQYIKNQNNNLLICDCRGGIDEDSLAVCKFADHIILIVETDAASFQTSIHLVDVLSDNDLAYKIKGFVINKVFDNPASIVNNGQGAFRAEYLSAIPFDLDAIRCFLLGDIPLSTSVFTNHIRSGIHKIFRDQIKVAREKVWQFEDYSAAALSDVDARTGGVALSAFLILIFAFIPLSYYAFGENYGPEGEFLKAWPGTSDYVVIASGLVAGFLGCVSVTRRFVGRVANSYVKMLGRFIGKGF